MNEEEEHTNPGGEDSLDFNSIWTASNLEFLQEIGIVQDLPVTDLDLYQLAHNMATQLTPPQQGSSDYLSIPAEAVGDENSDFAGSYGFSVGFPNQDDRVSSSSSWIYSEELDELYVRMNKECPIQVRVERHVPSSAFVRLTLVFRKACDQDDFPARCINHSGRDHETNRDHHAVQHVVRSYLSGADHVLDPETGRSSLLLPFSNLDAAAPTTYIVKFMCNTSCVGGMNRRPFNMVITLEHQGKCLGRRVKKAHVCAAPRRDIKNELRRLAHIQAASVGRPMSEYSPAFPSSRPTPPPSRDSLQKLAPLAQDVKRACKRHSSSAGGQMKAGHKQNKTYKIKTTSKNIYKILAALQPIVEANLRKQDAENSTEDDS